MYECISTITFALQHTKRPDGTDAKNAPAVVRLCTDKLREMVRDPDQNLKYLGLTGLMGLMRSNPRVVAEHRELVLACLTDDDVTIRLRALELVTGMVTRRNLPDIVKRFLELLETAEGHFRDTLMEKIVFICSRDKYAYLVDFAWCVGRLCAPSHDALGTRLIPLIFTCPHRRASAWVHAVAFQISAPCSDASIIRHRVARPLAGHHHDSVGLAAAAAVATSLPCSTGMQYRAHRAAAAAHLAAAAAPRSTATTLALFLAILSFRSHTAGTFKC